MKVYFMYSMHVFSQYEGPIEAEPLSAWLRERFAEDAYGAAFARDSRDVLVHKASLDARYAEPRNVLHDEDVAAFVAEVLDAANWEARG